MKKACYSLICVFLVVLLIILQRSIDDRYLYPFPPLSQLPAIDEKPYVELAGILLGLRSMAADIVWINTLQYYGGPTEGEEDDDHDEHTKEEGSHHHKHYWHDADITAYVRLLPLCKRAIWLDPYFMHVYYLGSGAIGFVQERYGEAAELLKDGIVWNYNPQSVPYWRMNYTLAALGYAEKHDYKKLTQMLEHIIDYNDSPLILLRVLANTYEKNREYGKATVLWTHISYRFPEAKEHAERKIAQLSLKQ